MDAIWNYIGIENCNPDGADRLIETFFDSCFFRSSRIWENDPFEHLIPGLRQFPAGSYIIYYTPLSDGVHIGPIAHGAMDQEAAFRRWLRGC